MKKIVSLFLSAVIAISIASLSAVTSLAVDANYPNQKLTLHAPRAASAPNIDDGGVKDAAYSGAQKIEFANIDEWLKNKKMSKHEAYIVWNGADIYIWAKVYDTTPNDKNIGANKYRSESYLTDCFEVYLNYDNILTQNVNHNNKLTAQLRVNPEYDCSTLPATSDNKDVIYKDKLGSPFVSKKTNTTTLPDMSNVLGINEGKTRAVVTHMQDGYVVEMKIHHDNWAMKKIGIGIQIQDYDANGKGIIYAIRAGISYFACSEMEELVLDNYTPGAGRTAWIASSDAAASASKAAMSSKNAASKGGASNNGSTSSRNGAASNNPTGGSTAGGTSNGSVIGTSSGTDSDVSGNTSSISSNSKDSSVTSGKTSEKSSDSDKNNVKSSVSASDEDEKSGLPVGAIIAIIAGGVVVLGGAAVAVIFLLKHKAAVAAAGAESENLDFGDGDDTADADDENK